MIIDTLRNEIADTWIMTRRNLIRYIRLPRLIFFSSVQPIMFLTLFNFVFGGAIGSHGATPGGKYINFLLPGILAQVVLFGAMNTGIGLAEDMNNGVIDRFRSLPISRAAVMAGRTVADMIRNLVVSIILLSVGAFYGFRFMSGTVDALTMILIMLAFGFAISWVFATIGIASGDAETAQLSGFLLIFPITFASAAFLPTSTMPGWLRAFADNQPITYLANASRYFASGVPYPDGTLYKLALWVLGILIIFVPLSVALYRKKA